MILLIALSFSLNVCMETDSLINLVNPLNRMIVSAYCTVLLIILVKPLNLTIPSDTLTEFVMILNIPLNLMIDSDV